MLTNKDNFKERFVEKVLNGELYWYSEYLIRADKDSDKILSGTIIASAEYYNGSKINHVNVAYVHPFSDIGYRHSSSRSRLIIMDLFKRTK